MTPSTKRVSHRGSLLKGVALHRVLYQSILNAKLTGRKNLDRKRCTSNRDDRKLENRVKQSRFKHLGELHKEWTEAGVNVRSILPGLWRKITGLLLSGPKSSFQMNVHFGNQGPRVWRKCGGIESMLLKVQCEVSTVSDDLGCHVICWCWSTVFSEVHSQRRHLPGNVSARHASFCIGLGTCPHCQRYQKLVQ